MRCICVSSLCGVCMWTPFLVGFMFAVFLCAMWLRVHAVYTRAMEGIVVGADRFFSWRALNKKTHSWRQTLHPKRQDKRHKPTAYRRSTSKRGLVATWKLPVVSGGFRNPRAETSGKSQLNLHMSEVPTSMSTRASPPIRASLPTRAPAFGASRSWMPTDLISSPAQLLLCSLDAKLKQAAHAHRPFTQVLWSRTCGLPPVMQPAFAARAGQTRRTCKISSLSAACRLSSCT